MNVTFTGAPMLFFSAYSVDTSSGVPTAPPWGQTAQSSIISSASLVTASIHGSNASQFGVPMLTAWTPVTVFMPPPPGGELPVGGLGHIGTGHIGTGHIGTAYHISGTSNGLIPLSINKGGYLTISVNPNPVVNGSDGNPIAFPPSNNRFVAALVVNGTYVLGRNWNSIVINLVLNAVQIQGSVAWDIPSTSLVPPPAMFVAGQSLPTGINWSGWSTLWPTELEDYPIQHMLSCEGFAPVPGVGEIVPGQLWMQPVDLIAVWSGPPPPGTIYFSFPPGGAIKGSVMAAPSAQATPPALANIGVMIPLGSLTQRFFNGSDVISDAFSSSSFLSYTILAV
jgi:hypothetical protein